MADGDGHLPAFAQQDSAAADPVPAVRRGRPRSTRAQDAIRAAATLLFPEHGFARTSVRDIAAAAGVDPALVIRHFGSKEALFLETVTTGADERSLVDGPTETLGRTVLRHLLEDPPESILPFYRALLAAVDHPDVRAYIQTALKQRLTKPLEERLAGPDRELRASLVVAQITGLLLQLAVAADPILDATDMSHVLDIYARGLQALIDDRS